MKLRLVLYISVCWYAPLIRYTCILKSLCAIHHAKSKTEYYISLFFDPRHLNLQVVAVCLFFNWVFLK